MNKAISDGFELMPPPFSDGLEVWSKGNGTPAEPRWADASGAALVTSDPDFGPCLELRKTEDVTRLRYSGETPILPGCYLRITARIKVLSGPLPTVRIGGWAGGAGGAAVKGLSSGGPSRIVSQVGEVIEVSAVVGTGNRAGVDMVWAGALYGHLGLDFSGPNGATLRIADLRIEDVTSDYLRRMMDWVDVRDFGALGDGVTDDSAAFLAADAAAKGRGLLVPDGVFHLGQDVTLTAAARFQGRIKMPHECCLNLGLNSNLDSYVAAFEDPEVALSEALKALFRAHGSGTLDLCGRTVLLHRSLDLRALTGREVSTGHRAIRNGRISCAESPAWETQALAAKACFDPFEPARLSNVDRIDEIQSGSLVSGAGVGRDVYVREVDTERRQITLSQPLHGAEARQSYVFRRFQYAIDFSGFAEISDVRLQHMELSLNARASGILLSPKGARVSLEACDILEPRDRVLSSPGLGCQDLRVERCQFRSAEVDLAAPDRRSVALNINGDNARIRDNRAVRFGSLVVANGQGHVFDGNDLLQGGAGSEGPRGAGIVLTGGAVLARVSGNFFESCGLEWTSEHVAGRSKADGFSGLLVTNNRFAIEQAEPEFRFLRVVPFHPGLELKNLSVTANLFRAVGSQLPRGEGVEASHLELVVADESRVIFEANLLDGLEEEEVFSGVFRKR